MNIFYYFFVLFWSTVWCAGKDVPVIGILSQESYSVDKLFPDRNYKSFIAASYVKFIESAGAKVVPVWIGRDAKYYRKVVDNTNGLLFPGGATWFNESFGYGDAGQMLYDFALEANQLGHYYPIFGICLGMELLAQVAINGQEIRAHCYSKNVALPLEFKTKIGNNKLFSPKYPEIIQMLTLEKLTYNYHGYCLTEQNFTRFGLDNDWNVLTINKDKNGLQFISSLESKNYPFYGVQFHPEKNMFEFKSTAKIPHSWNATKVSQYFANFFIEEARKNDHSFPDLEAEYKALIYNYSPLYSGIKNSSYEQVYMFTENDNNNIK